MVAFTEILVLAVGVIALITNGILLLILLKDPLKFFKVSTTYFIISLTIADLITGANACFWGIHEIAYPFPEDYQKYMLSVFWITTQASFLTLLVMSIERFLVVRYPFGSRSWITKKRVLLSIILVWIISIILGGLVLLPYPKAFYAQFSIFTEFCISVLLFAVLNVFILLGVRNSRKSLSGTGKLHKGSSSKLRKVNLGKVSSTSKSSRQMSESANEMTNNGDKTPALQGASENGGTKTKWGLRRWKKSLLHKSGRGTKSDKESDGSVNSRQSTVTRQKIQSKQENKLTAVVLLLVGVLALTVLPYLLASQIYLGYLIFCECPPPPGLMKFMHVYFPIELLNFAVNPLIYAWRLPQYRRSLKYLCTCHQAGGNSRRSTISNGRDGSSYQTISMRLRSD